MKTDLTANQLLETLGYGYFEIDLAGRLTYGNQLFFDAIGYTPDEVMGEHFRRYMDRTKVGLTFNIFKMIHATGMVERKLPLDFVHKDGSHRTAEGSVSLVRDEKGEPIGYRGILTEITDRKRLEASLVKAKEKAEKEIEIARDIQRSFLVKDYPQPSGWEIETYIRPARQVGGDFYDVFPINTTRHIALVMADVCDKGIGAAMYMAIFRSLFRAYSDQQYITRWAGVPSGIEDETPSTVFRKDEVLSSGAPSLKNAIDLTNNYIATHHSTSNMFATVFFGLLNPVNGTLLYINAGHEAPLLISKGNLAGRLAPTGPAVGMMPDMEFAIQSIALSPGDSIVAYTDGVPDALNKKNESFSEERLIATAGGSAGPARKLVKDIVSAVDKHIDKREQYDDITLLAIHRLE